MTFVPSMSGRERPSRFPPGVLLFLLLLFPVSALAAANCLSAQPAAKDLSPDELDRRAEQALAKLDFDEAEPLLRRQIEIRPREFVAYYNLACIRAIRHDPKEAGELLVHAVENGFDDYRKLTLDPHLANARNDPNYLKLANNWPTILEYRKKANLEQVRALFDHPDEGRKYIEVVDEKRRFIYRSAFDPVEFEKAKAEMEGLGDWAEKTIFPGLWDPKEIALDPWVIIVLPSRRDFTTWLLVTFGPSARTGFATIGGSYIHEKKQLVSQDLGSTLRHEFFHVLHWRDSTRKGQTHAYWVQEGLASLVEDVESPPPHQDKGENGEKGGGGVKLADRTLAAAQLTPIPSWRTNIVIRRDRSNTLMPLEKFVTLPRDKFLSSQQLANYAQARAIFLYLYTRSKLRAWYDAYGASTADPNAEPTPASRIFESVLGQPIRAIDKDFRAWIRTLPEVAEEIREGMASLGVEVETGTGDGVTITSLVEPIRPGVFDPVPNSTLKGVKGELRVGDVITAIGGHATRDVADLVRILGEKKPGDEVVVSYRRRSGSGEATIKLIAKP